MKAKVLAVNILDGGGKLVDARIDISCVYKLGDHARQPCDKSFLKNYHSFSCILPSLKTSLLFSLNTLFFLFFVAFLLDSSNSL
jgi:hypothetical protein